MSDQYGSTVTEKILARASGRERVRPGDLVMAKVSLAMANDITAPMAIDAFRKIGVPKVWDRDRIALVPSHFVPAKDIASASLGMRPSRSWYIPMTQARPVPPWLAMRIAQQG